MACHRCRWTEPRPNSEPSHQCPCSRAEILFKAFDFAKGNPAMLPDDFNLSDATLAAPANSALDLVPEDRLRATEVRDVRPAHWRLDGLRFEHSQP